nr:unnamed protein product [Callosobruchus analis]
MVDNNSKTGRGRRSFTYEKEVEETFGLKINVHQNCYWIHQQSIRQSLPKRKRPTQKEMYWESWKRRLGKQECRKTRKPETYNTFNRIEKVQPAAGNEISLKLKSEVHIKLLKGRAVKQGKCILNVSKIICRQWRTFLITEYGFGAYQIVSWSFQAELLKLEVRTKICL